MRERRHREDAPWPGSVATNCVSCYRRWPCEGFQTEEYIANLEHLIDEAFDAFVEQVERAEAAEVTGRAAVRALAYIRAQADAFIGGEPYLVSAGGFYRADAVLATDTAKAWLSESDGEVSG